MKNLSTGLVYGDLDSQLNLSVIVYREILVPHLNTLIFKWLLWY